MVLNNSCRKTFSWDRPQKLKHLALPNVYYKLLQHFTYLHIIDGDIVAMINFKVVDQNQ